MNSKEEEDEQEGDGSEGIQEEEAESTGIEMELLKAHWCFSFSIFKRIIC
jgi:hypothetical protein